MITKKMKNKILEPQMGKVAAAMERIAGAIKKREQPRPAPSELTSKERRALAKIESEAKRVADLNKFRLEKFVAQREKDKAARGANDG